MENFELQLRRKFTENLSNNFLDNHDTLRFGKEKNSLKENIKSKVFKHYTPNGFLRKANKKLNNFLSDHLKEAATCYGLLANDQSRNLYMDLICYYLLGEKKVKIFDTNDYLARRENMKYSISTSDKIKVSFFSWELENFLVKYANTDLQLFSRPSTIFQEFVVEQYAYRHDSTVIDVEDGDICIDGGACWGDATLLFATKAGKKGKVFSFEFIPNNLKIFERNLAQNPDIGSNVEVIKSPLWSTHALPVWYTDRGPGSQISFNVINGADGTVNTYTIDQLVAEKKLEKLDFIKMDIEGAETHALEGARQSIVRFKPKLAICIYHSMDDFTKIAQWINNLKLGYKFYIKHVTIHWEETVLFAI